MLEMIGTFFNLQDLGYGWASFVIIAIVGVATYLMFNKSPVSDWFKASEDVVPPFLALPAILFALFVTALATDVWQKHYQAKEALIREAGALRGLIMLGSELGANGDPLNTRTKAYIDAVIHREWVAMTHADHAHKETALPEMQALDVEITKIGSSHSLPQFTAMRINNALDTIRIARLQRISLAHDPISISKWSAAMALGILTLVSVAVVHLRRPRAMLISIILTQLCVIGTIGALSKNRSPYVGPAAVANTILVQTLDLASQGVIKSDRPNP